MLYINDRRKKLSLSLGIFIGIITLFINLIGTNIFTLYSDINILNDYESTQAEKYLDYSLDTQLRVAKAIQTSWSDYSNKSYIKSLDYLKEYIDLIVSTILDIHIRSSIVVIDSDNTVLYNGYMNKSYYNICEIIDSTEFKDDSLHILNGEPDKPFGTGDRLYVVRKTLKSDNGTDFYVYVAFSEKIIYEGFFGSLDKNMILSISNKISAIMFTLAFFLITCIIYGWYLIFYIRSFQEKIFNSKITK